MKRILSSLLAVLLVLSSFTLYSQYSQHHVLAAEEMDSSGSAASSGPTASSGPGTSWRFDLGLSSSPVAEGYIGINEATVYNSEIGYGLLAAVDGRDQEGDDVTRDFLLMAGAVFVVDVPNGFYDVKVTSGSIWHQDNYEYNIEGHRANGRTSAGSFADNNRVVEVTDGQLTIEFGGAQYSRTNAIEVVRLPDSPFLTAASIEAGEVPSVMLTWEEAEGATGYRLYRKHADEAEFTLVGQLEAAGYMDTQVEVGHRYEYQLSSLMGEVEAPRGPVLSVTVITDLQWATASLTGPMRVYENQMMSLTIHVDQVSHPFDTADIVVKYDPVKLSAATVEDEEGGFSLASEAITTLHDDLHILSTSVKEAAGEIRIIISTLNAEKAIAATSDLLSLNMKVKSGIDNGTIITSITACNLALEGAQGDAIVASVQHGATLGTVIDTDKQQLSEAINAAEVLYDRAMEGTKLGQYTPGAKGTFLSAIQSAKGVQNDLGATQLEVDTAIQALVNATESFAKKLITLADGQTQVSIRDLSLLANHFAQTSEDEEWELVAPADLFDEGEITIRTLAAVAKLILTQWSLEG